MSRIILSTERYFREIDYYSVIYRNTFSLEDLREAHRHYASTNPSWKRWFHVLSGIQEHPSVLALEQVLADHQIALEQKKPLRTSRLPALDRYLHIPHADIVPLPF